jgi:hypothetical protein
MRNKELISKKFESIEYKIKQLRFLLSDRTAVKQNFIDTLDNLEELINEVSQMVERDMNPNYSK